MSSSPEFVRYLCEQLEGTGEVRFRKMFGEYWIYLNDRPAVLVCGNTPFIKPLPCVAELLKERPMALPYEGYEGTKLHYVLDPDDGETLRRAALLVSENTPLPKKRRPAARREKILHLPQAAGVGFVIGGADAGAARVGEEEPLPEPKPEPERAEPVGKYPCPCCGYLTFPVPREEALAYICPVCYWENDLFDPGEDDPSDENRGMTLRQGRENYRKWGAVREDLVRHARPPRPEEIGPDAGIPWDAAWPAHARPAMENIAGWVGSPLFSRLQSWMEDTYGVQPAIEFSRCAMDRGWNVKYKKGSRSLCVCYVRPGWFAAMVTVGAKQMEELNRLLPAFSEPVRRVIENTRLFNGGKWLVLDVKQEEQLEDVQRLILLKARPPKGKQ